jgi:hypothetical protein
MDVGHRRPVLPGRGKEPNLPFSALIGPSAGTLPHHIYGRPIAFGDRPNSVGVLDLRHGIAGEILLNPMTMSGPRRKGDRDRPREWI